MFFFHKFMYSAFEQALSLKRALYKFGIINKLFRQLLIFIIVTFAIAAVNYLIDSVQITTLIQQLKK